MKNILIIVMLFLSFGANAQSIYSTGGAQCGDHASGGCEHFQNPCPDGLDGEILLILQTDGKAFETRWFLRNQTLNTLVAQGVGLSNHTLYESNFCVQKDHCFEFIIEDGGEDGLESGLGFYEVIFNGRSVKIGGAFSDAEMTALGACCDKLDITLAASSSCMLDDQVLIYLDVRGGIGPIHSVWSNDIRDVDFQIVSSALGNISVQVLDAGGCFALASVDFSNLPQEKALMPPALSLAYSLPGAACDDGNPNTQNDQLDDNCICIGDSNNSELTLDCPDDILVNTTDPNGIIVEWDLPEVSTNCLNTGGGGNCIDDISGFEFLGAFEGHHYFISENATWWENARQMAEANGGNLVIFDTEEEHHFIANQVNNIFHIGLSDAVEEGNFQWEDGSTLSFDFWAPGFFENTNSKDYGVFNAFQNGWNVVNFWSFHPFVMEIPCGGGASFVLNQIAGLNSGSQFPVGTTTISYHAGDFCNNESTCSFLVTVQSESTCNNISNAGSISGTETSCEPFQASIIQSLSGPTGGDGNLEIQWQRSNVSETGPWNNSSFNSLTLNPGFVSQTTWFRRGARRSGCDDFIYTTPIVKAIENCTGDYCDSNGQAPWEEWIRNVKIHTLDHNSGKDGYGDFLDKSTSLEKGTSYQLSVQIGYSWFQWDEYVRAWIDFNQDGDFSDANELVLSKISFEGTPPNPPAPVTQIVGIPSNAISGNTRMRIAMKRGEYPEHCETFQKGEVEDYTIHILDAGGKPFAQNLVVQANDSYKPFLHFYPNPASTELLVNLEDYLGKTGTIQVYNNLGQLMLESVTADISSDLVELEVGKFENGIYQILFRSEGKIQLSGNFVIMK